MDRVEKNCTAFAGSENIASGEVLDVAIRVHELMQTEHRPILIFSHDDSQLVEIDFRGTADDVRNKILASRTVELPPEEKPLVLGGLDIRGRGRPKLGVVAREVTLLPRHWEWLNVQPGGASVALRKLVDNARRTDDTMTNLRRTAQEVSYRFMSAMAGNLPRFEDASRALFSHKRKEFNDCIESWPPDIISHLEMLSKMAFSDD